uniref:Cystatin domain-containing protein n=1 Tax=Hippocampus comes TaxID=109280 RepID=A0A3Q2Y9J5_HIPCM
TRVSSRKPLVVFIFLGVVCAVGLGRLVGGLTDVDVNEEGVQNALNFAISQHNLKTEDPFLRVKTGVVGVKKQIVSGIKYVITVNMTKTNCMKDAPNEQCDGLCSDLSVKNSNLSAIPCCRLSSQSTWPFFANWLYPCNCKYFD